MQFARALAISIVVALSVVAGPAAAQRKYVIRQGDTPAGVARKLGVPLDELMRFNSIGPDGPFKVGQELLVPRPGEVTGTTYTVKPGDSVAKVADFHGVSQEDLRAANRMKPDDVLKPGQEIVVPTDLRGGAERSHVVQKGDTLASIAKRFGVTPRALARENKLSPGASLKPGRTLVIPDPDEEDRGPVRTSSLVKSGKVVPTGVMHTVQPGQNLWVIARAYNVAGEKILEANRLENARAVTVGKEILVPGATAVVPVRVKGYSPLPVHFVRIKTGEEVTIKLMTKAGRVRPEARRILSKLSGPLKKGQRGKLLHPRLLHMIQRVAERYPGHIIDIVSGYRPLKPGHRMNKHAQARALDFRVRGVPNRELYDFIRGLPDVGAGYYPNSVFVHMDVRDRPATWTDWSGPGEPAQYQKPAEEMEAEAEADATSEDE